MTTLYRSNNHGFGLPIFFALVALALLAAFDSDWNAAVPYSTLIRPNGDVVYKLQGAINPLEMRRMIIANLPDDDYLGHQAYWQTRTEP